MKPLAAAPYRRRPTMLSKVPEITAYFWIVKVLTTAMGDSSPTILSTT